MRKKNWIEFSNLNNIDKFNNKDESKNQFEKIKVFSQKKGKGGKTITLITGLKFDNILHKNRARNSHIIRKAVIIHVI